MSKKLRIFITASLALNIVLLGLTGGHLLKRAQQHRQPPPSLEALLKSVNDETTKQEIRAALTPKKRGEMRQKHQQLQQARSALVGALTAPTFDPELYQEKADALHQMHAGRGKQMAQTMKQLAMKLNQQQRIQLAEQMKRQRPPKR